MKKVLLFTAGFMLLAAAALAQAPVPPTGVYEVEIWYLDSLTGMYSGQPSHIGEVDQLARCFASNEAKGYCNRKFWHIPVTVHASVAQWIDFTMTGTRWDWFVRKPGWYGANCITAKVASNGDVLIDYDGFGDLLNLANPTQVTPIPIWYGFGGSIAEAQSHGWIRAVDLNNSDDLLVENSYWVGERNLLHESLTWKLFNRIHVVTCNTACEYEDVASLTLVANSQKPWIEQNEQAPNYGLLINPFLGPGL